MTKKTVAALALLAGLATTACDSIGQAMTAHTDVLARAAGHELKVDKTASMIAANPQIPAQPDVVVAVASLWIDYMLLATAASRDSTLHNINLDELLLPVTEQESVQKLRDKVIKVDTAFTDAQLKQLYEQSGVGSQVRARHILLKMAPDAPPNVRDSVTKLATSLRDQARSGSDFAELAKKYSQDTSAPQGGDLGYFDKTQMVAPFADAAFKLQPGQISDVVETPYGLHVIKVEDRKTSNFDSAKVQFRAQATAQKVQEAEQSYVKNLTDSANIKVKDGAYAIVKDLGVKPETPTKGRGANRELVEFKGGSYTVGDFLQFIRRLQPQQRATLPQRSDEELKGFLEGMARNKILVLEARKQGMDIPKPRLDSLRNEVYTQLAQAVQQAGLRNIQPQQGESKDQAIERHVNGVIEAIIKGQQNPIPLGALSYSLREQFDGEVFERAVPAVVTKVEAARPPQPQQPQQLAPQAPPPTTRDTTKR
jgi:PPIC-type PPIASE domain